MRRLLMVSWMVFMSLLNWVIGIMLFILFVMVKICINLFIYWSKVLVLLVVFNKIVKCGLFLVFIV